MDVFPMPGALDVRPGTVDAGWSRAITRGPMTVQQVLDRARAQMDLEDEAEERERDPFRWVTARRPRRRLLDRLRRHW